MNLSDYFINGRYLFGFVLPGALWIAALTLFFGPKNLEELRQSIQQITVGGWIIFVVTSLLIGHTVGQYSFAFVRGVSRFLVQYIPLRPFAWGGERKRLASQAAAKVILKRAVIDVVRSRWNNPDLLSHLEQNDNHLHLFCKRYVLNKSESLGEKVSEFESEINLRAMFVPPILAFALALIVNPVLPYSWPLYIVLLVVAFLLCTWVDPVCSDEDLSIYEMFLVIAYDTAPPPAQDHSPSLVGPGPQPSPNQPLQVRSVSLKPAPHRGCGG
jgi:hypothetical protein